MTFTYNTQVYRITNNASFELVLSKAPKNIVLQMQPTLEKFESSRKYYLKWQSWLNSLMEQTNKRLHKKQAHYKRNLDARQRKLRYEILVESFLSLQKEQMNAKEPKDNLALVAILPYQLKESNENMVVIFRGDEQERVSRDRIE